METTVAPRDSEGQRGDLVSDEVMQMMNVVLGCGIQMVIVLIGIPGNIFSLVVFVKQGLWDRVNVLLFSLAVADLINITTLLIIKFRCFLQASDPVTAANWEVLTTPQVAYINRWANFVSGFLIVIMAGDRCISVVFPLKATRVLTYRRMLTAIVTVYLVLFAAYAPNLFLYTVKWRLDHASNKSIAVFTTVDNFSIDKRLPGEIVGFFSIVIKPASVCLVVICTIVTVIKLKQATRKRHDMTSDSRPQNGQSETRITRMLIFLSVIYVILVFPEIAAAITHEFVPQFFVYSEYHNTFVVVYAVIQTASALNSSVNFFAYLLLSSKFRVTLANAVPCFKCLLKSNLYSQNNSHGQEQTNVSEITMNNVRKE